VRVRVPAGFAQAQQLELAWAEGVDTLYKFRSDTGPSRRWVRQILKNSRIYFSTPSQFNDPFDVSPIFRHSGDPSDHKFVAALLRNQTRMAERDGLSAKDVAALAAQLSANVHELHWARGVRTTRCPDTSSGPRSGRGILRCGTAGIAGLVKRHRPRNTPKADAKGRALHLGCYAAIDDGSISPGCCSLRVRSLRPPEASQPRRHHGHMLRRRHPQTDRPRCTPCVQRRARCN
jgi:hypothetical protein